MLISSLNLLISLTLLLITHINVLIKTSPPVSAPIFATKNAYLNPKFTQILITSPFLLISPKLLLITVYTLLINAYTVQKIKKTLARGLTSVPEFFILPRLYHCMPVNDRQLKSWS